MVPKRVIGRIRNACVEAYLFTVSNLSAGRLLLRERVGRNYGSGAQMPLLRNETNFAHQKRQLRAGVRGPAQRPPKMITPPEALRRVRRGRSS